MLNKLSNYSISQNFLLVHLFFKFGLKKQHKTLKSETNFNNVKNHVTSAVSGKSDVKSNGGADENRTRVRKQIHPSFSECRLCLTFPLPKLHNQSYGISSL